MAFREVKGCFVGELSATRKVAVCLQRNSARLGHESLEVTLPYLFVADRRGLSRCRSSGHRNTRPSAESTPLWDAYRHVAST